MCPIHIIKSLKYFTAVNMLTTPTLVNNDCTSQTVNQQTRRCVIAAVSTFLKNTTLERGHDIPFEVIEIDEI